MHVLGCALFVVCDFLYVVCGSRWRMLLVLVFVGDCFLLVLLALFVVCCCLLVCAVVGLSTVVLLHVRVIVVVCRARW